MALDLYSDNTSSIPTTTIASPRISFSYDLSQNDTVPVEQLLRTFSSSSVDFNFCVHDNSNAHHASMADELFFDGKMLPTEVKPLRNSCKMTSCLPDTPRAKHAHSQAVNVQESEEELTIKQHSNSNSHNNNNNNTKSFWGFKRSSSCGSGYARSLCPITLLSRSHSTGSSSTSSKRSSCSKDGFSQKTNRSFQKPSVSGSGSVSQKPPLRKSGYSYGNGNGNGNGNGIRVNPVLNLGFGSFFSSNSNSKGKSKK